MPPMVYFTEAEPIAEVFRASPDVLQGGRSNALLDFLTGPHSVARLDGCPHRHRRRELTSPFCRLGPDFAATMAANAIRAFRDTSRRTVSFRELSRALTLRNLVDCTLGIGRQHTDRLRGLVRRFMDDSLHPVMAAAWLCMDGKALRKAMTRWLAPASTLPGLRWLPFASLARTVQELDGLLYEAIDAARQREGDLDLLSVLTASETYAGDEAIRDELMTMLVAGHETTATTMDWFLVETFSHPEVLARVQQEVRDVLGEGACDASMTGRMPYLRAVINEVLRLHPPVPGVGRYVAKPTTIGGVDLPVGAGVSPCITLLHRNPRRVARPALLPSRALPRHHDRARHLHSIRGRYPHVPGQGVRPLSARGRARDDARPLRRTTRPVAQGEDGPARHLYRRRSRGRGGSRAAWP